MTAPLQENAETASGSRAALHARAMAGFEAEARQHEQVANRYSLARLVTFVAAAVCFGSGLIEHSALELVLGALATVAFVFAVVLHARTIAAQTRAELRRAVHVRHLARVRGGWNKLPRDGAGLLPREHAYAFDIDLVGHASLFQRLCVTHTREGEALLAEWLGRAANAEVIEARQLAVRELETKLELRQELEAAAGEHDEPLDARGIERLARLPALFEERAWLRVLVFALPLTTLLAYVAASFQLVPKPTWLVPALAQALLLTWAGKRIRRAFDVVAAKLPVLESFERLLFVIERASFEAPLLQSIKARVSTQGVPPSAQIKRIARLAGYAELRSNFLFHVVIDNLTLWDLHVLWGIERFVRDVGSRTGEWFTAIGELEALASLATLAHGDPDASMPSIGDSATPLMARGLGHPLLLPELRVRNDVQLHGPSSALVVTGSNMAGKSTLLRSLGQNIALALAGGPVTAAAMTVPMLRLRASMRAEDSLEGGSSYFHAELDKLKRVIEGAQDAPPVFFLLDELLRGTNARARHIGAKAVLLHLLARRGSGLCATHDVELAALGNVPGSRIDNVHFTDVVIDGEMRFDYKLRNGIVKTSNALRLLAMAGVDVPEQDRIALEGPNVATSVASSVRAVVSSAATQDEHARATDTEVS